MLNFQNDGYSYLSLEDSKRNFHTQKETIMEKTSL